VAVLGVAALKEILGRRGLVYVVAITTLLILVGGGCLSILEPEANVFFTAFNLADVGSMQSADMGELLLGPLPGQTTLMNPFAQKFQ
jgi:Na+/H+-dicarboxylate symporter